MTTKTYKFPKSLASCADKLFELRQSKSEAQHGVDKIDDEIKALQAYLIEELPKIKATGIVGKLAKVEILASTVPVVEDWATFYKYMAKEAAWDLLQKRLANPAVEARWEAGTLPAKMGLNRMHIKKLSVTKA
jgi:hypothetical protein